MNYGQRFVTLRRTIKTIHKKKKCQKGKWLSEEGLQIGEKRREAKVKGEKERSIVVNYSKLRGDSPVSLSAGNFGLAILLYKDQKSC